MIEDASGERFIEVAGPSDESPGEYISIHDRLVPIPVVAGGASTEQAARP